MEIGAFALSSASKRTALVSSTLFLSLSLSLPEHGALLLQSQRASVALQEKREEEESSESFSFFSFLFFFAT